MVLGLNRPPPALSPKVKSKADSSKVRTFAVTWLLAAGERRVTASTSNARESFPHLAIDPVDLPVLILQLAAHVDRHVSQITDHRVHLAHVLLHLRLAGVVRDLGDVAALWPQPVAIVHHSLGLVVHHLTVIVALPCALVLLEAGAPTRHQ